MGAGQVSEGMCFCFQAEDGIRDLVRSRGLGDVYKRQALRLATWDSTIALMFALTINASILILAAAAFYTCLLYTSDAADERSSVDLGGRRIIKKKTHQSIRDHRRQLYNI